MVDLLEVAIDIFVADGFEHFDRGDLVELPAQVAVIAEEDLDFFAEPGGLDAARGFVELLLRDGDGGDAAAVGLRGVHAEPAPAGADLEHAVGRGDVEAAAELVVFADLGGFERFVGAFEIRARVGHRRVEPELEELVAEVVVLANVLAAHPAAVWPAEVQEAVGEIQEIEGSGAAPGVGLQGLGLIGIENEPGDDFDEIRSRPLVCHVGFRKTDRAVEHAAFKEIFVQHLDAGFDAGAETAVDAPRAIGQQNLHATGLELGETIKNKASEKHCGLAR